MRVKRKEPGDMADEFGMNSPAGNEGKHHMGGGEGPAPMKTFIGKGSEFVGKLTFEGTVQIDGKVKGEIFSKGTLMIGADAEIEATINVDSVIISGKVSGNIFAGKRTEIRAPGRLYGDIRTPNLMIEQGVIFEGSCKMENLDKKAADPAKPRSGNHAVEDIVQNVTTIKQA